MLEKYPLDESIDQVVTSPFCEQFKFIRMKKAQHREMVVFMWMVI